MGGGYEGGVYSATSYTLGKWVRAQQAIKSCQSTVQCKSWLFPASILKVEWKVKMSLQCQHNYDAIRGAVIWISFGPEV